MGVITPPSNKLHYFVVVVFVVIVFVVVFFLGDNKDIWEGEVGWV